MTTTSRLIEILYNASSVDSSHQAEESAVQLFHFHGEDVAENEDRSDESSALDHEVHLFESLENLFCQNSDTLAQKELQHFSRLIRGPMTLGIRVALLRGFNSYVKACAQNFPYSVSVFQGCLEVIVTFKKQMDDMDARFGHRHKEEWLELERAIYLLGVWEEGLDQHLMYN